MNNNRWMSFKSCALSVLIVFTWNVSGYSQEVAKQPDAQAVSQTGLLPLYGVDFNFEQAWVDGKEFPSKSTQHPNFGVNGTFQKAWEALKPSGFNLLRFPVDVRDAQGAANRSANLCVWAKNNDVKLVPVLVSGEKGQPVSTEYPANVAAFLKRLVTLLRSGDGQHVGTYTQILAYQLENEMNHTGLHGATSAQSAPQQLLEVAATLRTSEQEALDGTDLNATPIMINASFDHELIKVQAIAGVALADDAYKQAYDALKQFLAPLASSGDVDLIGIDWFAGSVSAGTTDKFPALLRDLVSELGGKQIVFTTGFSTAFRTAEEQKQFYRLTFTNLADYRANEGVDCPFIGVIFHEAFNGAEPNPAPPTAELPGQIAQWDWSAKAGELAQTWSGQATSEALAWWLKKVENNMGLLSVQAGNSSTGTVAAQPAQKELQQIASTVSEANSAAVIESTEPKPESQTSSAAVSQETQASTSTTPGLGAALKEKGQQYLITLLDRMFQRLDQRLDKTLGNIVGGGSGNIAADGTAGTTGTPPEGSVALTVSVSKEEVSIQPGNPTVGNPVTFSVTVHNKKSDADAAGLVVAVTDATAAVAYVTDVAIGRSSAQKMDLTWTPTTEGTYNLSLQVYDASLTSPLASASLDPLLVAAASASSGGGSSNALLTVTQEEVSIQPASPIVGSPVTFNVAVHNQSSDTDATDLVVAVVVAVADGTTEALAYATDIAVGRGATQKMALEWTPTTEGTYQLSLQVYDASLNLPPLANASLNPLAVSAAPADTPAGGTSDSGSGTSGGSVRPGVFRIPPRHKTPLGMPKVHVMNVAAVAQVLVAGQPSSVSVSMSNPYSRPIINVLAKLVVDGQVTHKKMVGTLPPKVSRSVVFPNVTFAQPGKHEVKVVFETGGPKPRSGSVSGQVQIRPKALAGVRPILGGLGKVPDRSKADSAATTTSAAAQARPAVRMILPTAFKVRGLSIPTTDNRQTGKTAISIKPRIDLSRTAGAAKDGAREEAKRETTTLEKGSSTPRITIPQVKRETTTLEKGSSTPRVIIPRAGTEGKSEPDSRPALVITRPNRDITRAGLRPDVSVTAGDIGYSPNPPKPNTALSFKIRVRNLGDGDANGATLKCVVRINGKLVPQQPFSANIKANSFADFSLGITAPASGLVRLEVSAAGAQDVNNRNNNAAVNVDIAAMPRIRLRIPPR